MWVGERFRHEWSGSLQEYDPSDGSWHFRSDLPEVSGGSSAVSFGGKIYVVGGGSSTCMVYEPSTDLWSHLARPKQLHFLAAAAVWKKKIVICGGVNSNSIEEYDPETGMWSTWNSLLPKSVHQHHMLMLTALED